jgi:hypothetical protein
MGKPLVLDLDLGGDDEALVCVPGCECLLGLNFLIGVAGQIERCHEEVQKGRGGFGPFTSPYHQFFRGLAAGEREVKALQGGNSHIEKGDDGFAISRDSSSDAIRRMEAATRFRS